LRTRKSIGIGIGLVLLAIVLALIVGSWQRPAQPPLRAGMTIAEVQALMGQQDCWLMSCTAEPGANWEVTGMCYLGKTDYAGNLPHTNVFLDQDGRVTHWETGSQSGMCPPWWHRAKSVFGW
jgi:hypothetical protein